MTSEDKESIKKAIKVQFKNTTFYAGYVENGDAQNSQAMYVLEY